MPAQILDASGLGREAALEALCAELERGGVVALPTETVYGLAGDALNPRAVARIFEVKERPFFDPLICHVPEPGWLEQIASIPPEVRPLVGRLVADFWPGPLTLVLPKRACIPDLVSAGLPSVAVRWSAHPLFQAVVSAFGRPLAAPSANRFGRISPTSAPHVLAELGDRIALILDGGPTLHGVESTILAPCEKGIRIVRPGPITADELAPYAPLVEPSHTSGKAAVVEAPGQLKSHYAPSTPLFLHSAGRTPPPSRSAGILAWQKAAPGFAAVEILSPSGDLREAAARLFAALRILDGAGLECIHAELVPPTGLGVAINDRLERAAAK
jgi:L-threonylcarbamoyladenylate synthase